MQKSVSEPLSERKGGGEEEDDEKAVTDTGRERDGRRQREGGKERVRERKGENKVEDTGKAGIRKAEPVAVGPTYMAML